MSEKELKTPYTAVSSVLSKGSLEIGDLVPVDVPQATMTFLQALREFVLRNTRQGRESEDLENDFSDLLR